MDVFPTELPKGVIKSFIKNDNPIIMDVGCYDGKDGKAIMDYFAQGICYSFECDPRSIKLFESLNKGNKQLFLQKIALTNTIGNVDFHMSDSDTRRHYENQQFWSASSSIKKPKNHLELFPDVQFEKVISVNSITLDAWCDEFLRPNDEIDFIWCDVNGGEEEFLLGGNDTLNRRTKYLYIEFSDRELFENEITKNQICVMLPNFELLSVYNYLGNFGNLLFKNVTI